MTYQNFSGGWPLKQRWWGGRDVLEARQAERAIRPLPGSPLPANPSTSPPPPSPPGSWTMERWWELVQRGPPLCTRTPPPRSPSALARQSLREPPISLVARVLPRVRGQDGMQIKRAERGSMGLDPLMIRHGCLMICAQKRHRRCCAATGGGWAPLWRRQRGPTSGEAGLGPEASISLDLDLWEMRGED